MSHTNIKEGKCVYCLEFSQNLTHDHVIPSSWYPETTPSGLAKWKVPCCFRCNQRFSRIEKNLLERLGLCLDPNDERAKGVPQTALRALKSQHARNDRDARHRANRRAKILRETFQLTEVPVIGLLPNLGPLPGANYNGRYIAVRIPEADINEFGAKVIRGMTYVTEERYIEEPYGIEIFVVKEDSVPEVDQLLRQTGVSADIGPGIETIHAVAKETQEGLYWIRLWGRFELYGSVRNRRSQQAKWPV